MRFVGLDLSLTSTGVADGDGTRVLKVPLPPKATDLQRVTRLQKLATKIDAETRGADLVIIEGPSYGSENTHAHSTGELHGVVKCVLFQRRIPFVLASPHSLKKFAIGRGSGKGATKEAVFAAAVKRSGIEFQTNDESDAWWLLQMGYVQYADPRKLEMPQENQKALWAIEWPRLGRED